VLDFFLEKEPICYFEAITQHVKDQQLVRVALDFFIVVIVSSLVIQVAKLGNDTRAERMRVRSFTLKRIASLTSMKKAAM